MGKQAGFLKYISDGAAVNGPVLLLIVPASAFEIKVTLVRLFLTGDAAQQRGFAGA